MKNSKLESVILFPIIALYFFGISFGGFYIIQPIFTLYVLLKLSNGKVAINRSFYMRISFVLLVLLVCFGYLIGGFKETIPNLFTITSLLYLFFIPKTNTIPLVNSIVFFAVILSLWIWFVNYMAVNNGIPFSVWRDSDFHRSYIPGYPGNPVIPMSLAYFILLNRKNYILSVIILIGLFGLFTRLAYLAMFLIPISYFLAAADPKRRLLLGILTLSIVLIIPNIGILSDGYWKILFRAWDRIDVYQTSLSYIAESPFVGYGGRTIENIQHVAIEHKPFKNWGHAHSYLDLPIRHGVPVFLLWFVLIASALKEVHYRSFIRVFLILPFFQIFVRDYTFYFTLVLLIMLSRSDKAKIKFSGV